MDPCYGIIHGVKSKHSRRSRFDRRQMTTSDGYAALWNMLEAYSKWKCDFQIKSLLFLSAG